MWSQAKEITGFLHKCFQGHQVKELYFNLTFKTMFFGCVLIIILLLYITIEYSQEKQCTVCVCRFLKNYLLYMYFRNEKRFAVIEHLISAVNTFVLSIAQNSRAQVCKFGESICINMLYLWENRPSNTLKVWLLEILRFWNISCEKRVF